jgi:CRISPR-associated protein Csd2
MSPLPNRYDIVFLFDITNGNPNGDPDAGNLPRMDPETNVGLVSDVSLKRKIRNYTELARGDQSGYRIYVQEGSILNEKHREAYKAVRSGNEKVAKEKSLNPQNDEEARALTRFMCDNFFDVRAFGAVMSTGINAGQVRGPVQIVRTRSFCRHGLQCARHRGPHTAAAEPCARSDGGAPAGSRRSARTFAYQSTAAAPR